MIQDFQLVATNDSNESIQLTNGMPDFLTEFSGLDTPGTEILSVQQYNLHGAFYNGAHVSSRNIVLNVYIFNDVPRIRQWIYRIFKIGKTVNLYYFKDVPNFGPVIREIDAVVESVHFDIFSEPGRARQQVQISLICTQPFLRGGLQTSISGNEFIYNGDADCGIKVTLEQYSDIAISITHGGDVERLDIKDDTFTTLTIDTQERTIIRNRSDVITNAMNLWEHGSVWPKLKPGVNRVRILSGATTLPVDFTYIPLYQGV